ncbi:MAG: three-Cys-motif partner protein TcmP [Ignavibacteriaceae bacterium]|nr:three-Cys-motif partner protein TcmP [Ignavibacteriaceae bacterium]
MSFNKNSIEAFDDGLFIPEVGPWAENKYEVLHHYNHMFSTGMKNRFQNRVYIDLFSSAGIAKIRDSNRFVLTSSLIALNLPDPYDQYIYCDIDEKCISALSQRVKKHFPNTNANYIVGDCNERVKEILSLLPKPSRSNKVLTFCVVDPYNLGINFETMKVLNVYRVDFLVLLSWMDANRNEFRYVEYDNDRIDNFLGDKEWRDRWLKLKKDKYDFRKFLAEEYVQRMMTLGYPKTAMNSLFPIRSTDKKLFLYHLAFFSKSEKGYDFWNKARLGGPKQTSLNFED